MIPDSEKLREYRQDGITYLLDDEKKLAQLTKITTGRNRQFRIPDHGSCPRTCWNPTETMKSGADSNTFTPSTWNYGLAEFNGINALEMQEWDIDLKIAHLNKQKDIEIPETDSLTKMLNSKV